MGCHHLKVLIPAVISVFLLWEGVQCRIEGYSLHVPSLEIVQDGLCVHIQCRFTYPASRHDPHAPLYGSWYREGKQSRGPTLVATNNPKKIQDIDLQIRRRFEVSGPNLNIGDCSLTINDAEPADEATYHFRMDKGRHGFSYIREKEKVFVIVAERKINIKIARPMRAGQSERIFCETQRCSYLEIPMITWTHTSPVVAQRFRTWNQTSVEGRLEFISEKADNQQNVTCIVNYGEGLSRRSTKKTITLNVAYPPSTPRFSAQLQHRDGSVRNLPDVSGTIVARVGDALLVRCEADANPASSQTWVRPSFRPVPDEHVSNNNVLKFSNLHVDDGGHYECQAQNSEGSIGSLLYLRVTGNDYGTKG